MLVYTVFPWKPVGNATNPQFLCSQPITDLLFGQGFALRQSRAKGGEMAVHRLDSTLTINLNLTFSSISV